MDFLFAQTTESSGSIMTFLPMMLIIAIIYFLMIRPENQKKQKHIEMLKKLKIGDNIVTAGGIHAKIINFQGKNNNLIIMDTGNNKITISKAYVTKLIK